MSDYKDWFLAMRPWSFTMSAISVTVGATLAAVHGTFSWPLYIATALAMIAIHGGVNLLNDFFDFRSGVDAEGVATARYRPHPLVEGKIYPLPVLWVSILLFAAGAAIGSLLAFLRGWEIFLIGVIGLIAGICYTAPPIPYKYKALGEVSVFLMWGPLSVGAAFFVQTQRFSLDALLVSIPFGVLVALVLFANNLRDFETDNRAGVINIAIVLGRHNGPKIYASMVGAAILAVVIMSIAGPLSLWSLLILLSLPTAVKLIRVMIREVPNDADARTAQLNTVFGVLLILSLILEAVV